MLAQSTLETTTLCPSRASPHLPLTVVHCDPAGLKGSKGAPEREAAAATRDEAAAREPAGAVSCKPKGPGSSSRKKGGAAKPAEAATATTVSGTATTFRHCVRVSAS